MPRKEVGDRIKEVIICVLMLVLIASIYKNMCLAQCAKRLVQSGWVLLSKTRCRFCKIQKAILGSDYPCTIECDGGVVPEFVKGMVTLVFPTWYNTQTGEVREGVQEKEELREMADAV